MLTIKQANEVTGGLSSPSKMPGYAYGIPAETCKTGTKLRAIQGSVCSKCYACKGAYAMYKNVKETQFKRFNALNDLPKWVDHMVFLINKRSEKCDVFRWHDSGDLQSLEHLQAIAHVAMRTPTVKHWLPTKEYGIVKKYLQQWRWPDNLVVRVSMPKIGQTPLVEWIHTSTVDSGCGWSCPVKRGTEGCDTYNCRACWDGSVKNIDYHTH